MTPINWTWITVMAAGPPLPALLIAFLIWRQNQIILGNIAGAIVVFGTSLALIMHEHVQLDAAAKACLDAGYTCWPDPSAFTRYAIYASIGLIEVFALFIVSLIVEKRMRDSRYAPEWR
jgi:hypothetical protein